LVKFVYFYLRDLEDKIRDQMIKLDLNKNDSFKKFFQSLTVEYFDGQEASEKLENEINNLDDLTKKVKDLIKKDIDVKELKKYEFLLT
jgi:hypothetical protein